jgi:HSP20 family protein
MNIKDILPWKRKDKAIPVRGPGGDEPLQALRNDLDTLFDEFLAPGFDRRSSPRWFGRSESGFIPSADVTENDREVRVSMEVPGVEEKDVDVEIDGNSLIVRGEKKKEVTTEKEDYRHYERSFGSFQRVIPLPEGLEEDRARARFKKGVLTVTVPKSGEERRSRKRIEISG